MSIRESSFTVGRGGDADGEKKESVSADGNGDDSRAFFDLRGVPGDEVRARLPGEFVSASDLRIGLSETSSWSLVSGRTAKDRVWAYDDSNNGLILYNTEHRDLTLRQD